MAEALPTEHTLPDSEDECNKLGKWLCESTTKFEPKHGINECVDESLNNKIKPLFRKLGFEENPDYRVFHMSDKIHLRLPEDRYPYDAIALGGQKLSNATISYAETSAKVQVKIGTFIRVTRHAYFTSDWYCLVIPKSGLKE
ncbi:hypothetical protein TMEN_5061 [Trichophyton mentagrophytes]|nr:hypothetical protein TMEN_5061 [Trichophyton mentagrophytes]